MKPPRGFRDISYRSASATHERYAREDGEIRIERFGPRMWSIMPRGFEPYTVRSRRAAIDAARAWNPARVRGEESSANKIAALIAYNRASHAWAAAGFPSSNDHPTRAAMVAAHAAYRAAWWTGGAS